MTLAISLYLAAAFLVGCWHDCMERRWTDPQKFSAASFPMVVFLGLVWPISVPVAMLCLLDKTTRWNSRRLERISWTD